MRESSEAMVDAMLERLAQEVFVDHKQAFDWMDRPNIALGGATPRSMSRTAAVDLPLSNRTPQPC
ncbi:antitoxin Xre/MbcA/ParS toxin-binding domain-containing protein [Ectopseudomonas mendocina]